MSSSLGGAPGEGMLIEPVRPLLVVSDHPVPQCLAVHPADLRRFLPRSPVEYGRKRQKPSRLRSILCASRKPPNLTGRIVRPNRHCLAHGKHPPFAIFESLRSRFVNPPESQALSGFINSKEKGPNVLPLVKLIPRTSARVAFALSTILPQPAKAL